MSDEAPINLPGFTAETPKSDEPNPANQTPPEASRLEKIQRAVSKTFERHGVIFKKTGGRPRKDGLPNKGDVPLTAPATALPLGAAPIPPDSVPGLDPALVKKCCNAVLKAFSGFLDKILFGKARVAGYEPKDAQQLVADTRITQEEADSFSELAEICLRKYGVGTQYAPEIGLGAIVIGVGMRYAAAIKSLPEPKKEGEE